MKILLIIPNFNNKRFYVMPMGIMYISSYLKQNGYDVCCLNLNHYSPSKLSNILRESCYDVVGTGGLFIHISNIRNVIETTRNHSPNSKIVIGGAIASGDPEFILDELQPDYLVIGEGEVTMDNLLLAIRDNSNMHEIRGIAFKQNGMCVKTSPTPLIENLDQIPYPDYEGFDYGYYLDNFRPENQHFSTIIDTSKQRIASVVSSRDCVAKCTFCFRIMGGSFRTRSLENLFGEIEYLIEKYGINELDLMDDMFAVRKERVFEFCKIIKPMGIPWTCQVRVSMVNDDLLKTMKDAGCYLISYGFESGSRTVLKSMKKGITTEQIERAIIATIKAKITIQGNFIFGDPAETIETIEETISFGRKFKSTNIGFRLIAPYPGTVLYKDLKKKGMIKDLVIFYENSNQPINMTSLSDRDFLYLCRKVDFENNYRRRFAHAKILKLKKIDSQIFELTIRCPHCQGKNENIRIDFNVGNMLICKHCYQRVFINMADFRFRNISQIYQFCYFYIKRIVLHNAVIHRFLHPIPTLIEKLASVCRVIVNWTLNVRELSIRKRLPGGKYLAGQ